MHYTVAVIHHPNQSVEDLLAPFDENLEVADYIAETKEAMIENAKCEILNVRDRYKEGTLPNPKYFEETVSKYVADAENDNQERLFEFATRYCEEDDLDEDGNRHSTYNPNSKWDWYSVGGRWDGMLKLKDGCSGEFGTPGVFGSHYDYDDNRGSSARIGDIDFSPDEEVYKRALRWWEVVVENSPLKDGEDEAGFHSWYRIEYLKERYGTKEEYATEQAQFSTYTVLTPDGVWHEPGQMGWFSSMADTDDEKEWFKNYHKFIECADPNDLFTLVDCHI